MRFFFFVKQKTAYERRISDWSSDVCSSDLPAAAEVEGRDFYERVRRAPFRGLTETQPIRALGALTNAMRNGQFEPHAWTSLLNARGEKLSRPRSEEHTSELQSLMRISYAVFCLKKKNQNKKRQDKTHTTHTD